MSETQKLPTIAGEPSGSGRRFTYRALDDAGQDVAGEIVAASKRDAIEAIGDLNLFVYQLEQKTNAMLPSLRRRRSSVEERSRYLRQLATLVNANVPIAETLKSLERNLQAENLSQMTAEMARAVRSGEKFSSAFLAHFTELPRHIRRLAVMGETTGSLGASLMDASNRFEEEIRVRNDVRAALTYPLFLTTFGGAIVLAMFIFIVPRFSSMLDGDVGQLPLLSRFIIGAGIWLRANALMAGIATVVMIALGFWAARRDDIKSAMQSLTQRLPVLGNLTTAQEVGNWCSAVGLGLKHGASLMEALDLGEDAISTPAFSAGLQKMRRSVRAGQPLDVAIAESLPMVDAFVVDLVKTGRSSGALSEMLLLAAESYREEMQGLTKRAIALIEPISIAAIALVVGAIVIGIVLAMTSVYDISIQ